jgi:hypothetical protein
MSAQAHLHPTRIGRAFRCFEQGPRPHLPPRQQCGTRVLGLAVPSTVRVLPCMPRLTQSWHLRQARPPLRRFCWSLLVFVYYLHFATRTRSAKRALGLGPIVMQSWPHGYSMAILKPKRNCQVPISHEFLHGKYVVAATLLLRALVLYCTDRGPSELLRAAGVV